MKFDESKKRKATQEKADEKKGSDEAYQSGKGDHFAGPPSIREHAHDGLGQRIGIKISGRHRSQARRRRRKRFHEIRGQNGGGYAVEIDGKVDRIDDNQD